jgi:hypothetical protein
VRKKEIKSQGKKQNTMHKSFELYYLEAIKKAHDNFLVLGRWRKKKIES